MWISLEEDTARYKKEVARRIWTARHLHEGAAKDAANTNFDDLHDMHSGDRFHAVVKEAMRDASQDPAHDYNARLKAANKS